MLNPDDPRQTRLDLIEWVSPDDHRPPYEHLARLGINRIALWTVDLDDEYKRLKSDGVDFLSEPLFMGVHTKFVCFRDPDGTIIELIEFHRSPSGDELTRPVSSAA
jgi:catechol 2,3-dioxygenase-like lactoylglutathione lyase family enzyme